MEIKFDDYLISNPGITKAHATVYKQACVVALMKNSHIPSCKLVLTERPISNLPNLILNYIEDSNLFHAYNDDRKLAEEAGIFIAIVCVHIFLGSTFHRQSVQGDFCDYFIGDVDEDGIPEYSGILEVSGIVSNNSSLTTRVKEKTSQILKNQVVGLKKYVCVTDFVRLNNVFKEV